MPTLLFGHDARVIYAEEIESGEFSWTEGRVTELTTWLDATLPARSAAANTYNTYIESSLAQAANMLDEAHARRLCPNIR